MRLNQVNQAAQRGNSANSRRSGGFRFRIVVQPADVNGEFRVAVTLPQGSGFEPLNPRAMGDVIR
jgi:hypothetical protein